MKWEEVVLAVRPPAWNYIWGHSDWCIEKIGIRGVDWNFGYNYPSDPNRVYFSFKNPGDAVMFKLMIL